MPLAPGTHLGPYEIQSPIGTGGMGEVYRAREAGDQDDLAQGLAACRFLIARVVLKTRHE